MSDVTEQTIDEWLSTVPRKRIRLHHEFSLLTLKILVKTLFGTHYQTLESEIQKTVDTYLKTIDLIYYRNSYYIYLFPWLSKLPICQKSALDKCNKDLLEFVNQIICDRKTKRTDEDDLLNLLLSTNNEFTDKQIREQVLSFITAGHETMTTLLTWAMFVLMTKPTVYEACRTEVDTVLKGEKPKSDQLDKFEILNAVVQETLRMYTPVPIFGRECIQEHSIGPRDGHQIQIPRGATILCNTNTVHRLPNFWRDPEEFDYTRWMKDENGCPPKLAHPCCFLPFSAGSRNCIGQNFALSEATIILATIVQQLNFEIVPEQQIIPDIKLTMKPKYDIYTDIFKRSN